MTIVYSTMTNQTLVMLSDLIMVETLKGLVQTMTGSSSSASKHDKIGITETANSNNSVNHLVSFF